MKKDMGGLASKMPVTLHRWIIVDGWRCAACRSSAGSSPRTRSSTTPDNNDYTVFLIIGLIGAFLTTAYMTRATYLTFFGKPRAAPAAPTSMPCTSDAR